MKKGIRRAAFCALAVLSHASFASEVSFEDLARHLQYIDVKISPDGRHIAATTVVKDKPLLAILDLDSKKGGMVTPRMGNQVVDFCGIVTMEDIIEELIQEDIVDETDIYIDVEHR